MKVRLLIAAVLTLPVTGHAASYFVAPSGSDSNVGSSALPFRTAAKGTSVLLAGDTLTIRPGTYRETTFVLNAGTAAAPITVQAEPGAVFESPNQTGHAEAINVGSNARYVRLLGIEARGGYGEAILVRAGAENIEIRDCRLHGNRVGLTIGSASFVTVDGCSLYENTRAGLRLTGTTHDITIVDTDAFNNSDGLGCAGEGDGFVSDDAQVSDISFIRTRSYDNSEDAYDVRGSNLIFDQIESRSFCNGFKLGKSASLSNCLVTGGRVGIETTAIAPDVSYSITNCTVAGSDFPIVLGAPVIPARSYDVHLFNNIVVGPNRALDYNSAIRLFEGHNIFWNGSVSNTLIKVLPSGGGYSGANLNSGAYRAATGRGIGTLAVDPLFTNVAAGNYIPDVFSAAVDRADASVAPLVDFNDVARPRGNGPDIGAFETAGSATNHRPQANAGSLRTRAARTLRITGFDASASFDPNGDPITYFWDFGDGSTSTLRQVYHAYTVPGIYTATLTVSDGQLSASDAVSVTVTGRPPRPTRPGATATPTPTTPPAATPTPTVGAPQASKVLLSVTLPSSVARGAQGTLSVRYRLLSNAATFAVDLPPEFEVAQVVPGGFVVAGNRLLWANAPRPSGSFKIKVRARSTATPGALVTTTMTLTESTGAIATRSGVTRIN